MTNIQPRTTTGSGSSPLPATRALHDLVSRYANRLEDDPDNFRRKLLSAAMAPRGADRATLHDRRDLLLNSLTPHAETVRPVVIALLGAFPAYGADATSAGKTVALVCRALDDVPTWSVVEAAERFLKGTATIPWDESRAPTAPQIRAQAKQCMLRVEEELHRLNQVLDATVVDLDTTEDERKEALAAWDALRAGITKTNVISERTAEEIGKERSEQARANARFESKREGRFGASTDEMRSKLTEMAPNPLHAEPGGR